jgi:hypothetical protein
MIKIYRNIIKDNDCDELISFFESNKDRIVYAGNYCIDIFNQPNYKKSII